MWTLARGHVAEAERLVLEALSQPDPHHVRAQVQDPLPLQLLAVRREQGRLLELEGAVESLVRASGPVPSIVAIHALFQAQRGRVEIARRTLEELAADDFARVPFDHNRLLFLAVAAEGCGLVGDEDLASRLYAQLAPFDGHAVVVADGLAFFDVVARPLGLLAGRRGDAPAAIAHLQDALRAYRTMGARSREVHTEVDLARLLAREGTSAAKAAARRSLEAAGRVAGELELAGLVAEIARLRTELG
jgi:hypothetical protein